MKIQNLRVIEKFNKDHADARTPMGEWIVKTEQANWSLPADVLNTFNSTSFVNSIAVFNISGNKFRLLADIVCTAKTVTVLKAGAHEDYNGWKL
jgi:mRNA interferase HigB